VCVSIYNQMIMQLEHHMTARLQENSDVLAPKEIDHRQRGCTRMQLLQTITFTPDITVAALQPSDDPGSRCGARAKLCCCTPINRHAAIDMAEYLNHQCMQQRDAVVVKVALRLP